LVKDQKILIELHPYFQSIFANKEKVEQEIISARTSKKPYIERQKGTFVPSHPIEFGMLNDVRTYLLNRPLSNNTE